MFRLRVAQIQIAIRLLYVAVVALTRIPADKRQSEEVARNVTLLGGVQ